MNKQGVPGEVGGIYRMGMRHLATFKIKLSEVAGLAGKEVRMGVTEFDIINPDNNKVVRRKFLKLLLDHASRGS